MILDAGFEMTELIMKIRKGLRIVKYISFVQPHMKLLEQGRILILLQGGANIILGQKFRYDNNLFSVEIYYLY